MSLKSLILFKVLTIFFKNLSNWGLKLSLEPSNMLINESINDTFKIDTLNDIIVTKSLFSEYNISSINNTIEVNAKNSDITVHSFDKNISTINIQNQNASVLLGLKDLDNYTLAINDKTQNSYLLPDRLKKISSNSNQLLYAYGTKPSKTKITFSGKHCEVKLE